MTLRDPETRKGLRAVVGALLAVALVALVWAHAARLGGGYLSALLQTSLIIVAIRVIFDGAENVTNAVRFKLGSAGFEGSVTDDVIKDGDSVTVSKDGA